ncbi:DUF4430 domain-containing protein [Patescibacteria group bacterium]|nr:DUF4430 domain-containing protein [Patescibacteria group bacterium]
MKTIAKIIIILAVFFVGFYFGQQQASSPVEQETVSTQEAIQRVSLMLDFGNGTIKTFRDIEWKQGMNVFDLLKSVAGKNNLEFSYKDYEGDLGVFIKSIDNLENSAEGNFWWQYWVNNKYGKVGSSNYILKPGDVIEWKLVRGQL